MERKRGDCQEHQRDVPVKAQEAQILNEGLCCWEWAGMDGFWKSCERKPVGFSDGVGAGRREEGKRERKRSC